MKKKMTILGGLLLAVVVTGYSVAGTYAKYAGSADVTASARVAKFEVTDKEATFDIFNTMKDTNTIIAPGYSNSIELTVANMFEVNSEVPTTATFSLVEDGTDASKSLTYEVEGAVYDPMMYALVEKVDDTTTVADSDYKTWEDFKTAVTSMEADKTYIIAWKWADDNTGANDEKDTALGNAIATALEDATTNAANIEKLTVRLTLKASVVQDTTKLNQAN